MFTLNPYHASGLEYRTGSCGRTVPYQRSLMLTCRLEASSAPIASARSANLALIQGVEHNRIAGTAAAFPDQAVGSRRGGCNGSCSRGLPRFDILRPSLGVFRQVHSAVLEVRDGCEDGSGHSRRRRGGCRAHQRPRAPHAVPAQPAHQERMCLDEMVPAPTTTAFRSAKCASFLLLHVWLTFRHLNRLTWQIRPLS